MVAFSFNRKGNGMVRIIGKRRTAWHVAGLAMFAAGGIATAQTAPPQVVQIDQLREPTYQYLVQLPQSLPESDYWIGIALGGGIPDVVKAQLDLEYGQIVADVIDDSPAAKAGFRENDVLLEAGENPLREPADVIKAVDEAKETELTITLVRDGKRQMLKVTPIKRPQVDEHERPGIKTPEVREEISQLEEALMRLKAKVGEETLSIFLARPPVVAHREVLDPVELPKNVKIRVTKEGDKPAQIHVQRDDEEWDVTEETLDKLPEELREHVQPFLSRPHALRLKARAIPAPGAMPGRPVPSGKMARKVEVQRAPPQSGAIRTPDGGSITLSRPTPPVAIRTVPPHAPSDAKLDAILKKLEHLEGQSIEKLEMEIKRLRQELDELRGNNANESAKP
jgi:hypothetical protein